LRFTLDTNILVYAAHRDAGAKHVTALEITRRAVSSDCVLTLQSLSELFRTLTGPKLKISAVQASEIVQKWRDAIPVVAADELCLIDAMDAVVNHGWSFWDAMIWATAKRNGCRLLISEDGQAGRTLGAVTIVNPFVSDAESLLEAALGSI